MNGFVAFVICIGMFFAGLESGVPGITAKAFVTAATVYHARMLPAQLDAAILAVQP